MVTRKGWTWRHSAIPNETGSSRNSHLPLLRLAMRCWRPCGAGERPCAFPDAVLLVCDSYNAPAIGFGPTDRVKDVVFSLATMPRWVTLFFTRGVKVATPKKVLGGAGRQVRLVHLSTPEAIDPPAVHHLMARALVDAEPPIGRAATGGIVIKSISAE